MRIVGKSSSPNTRRRWRTRTRSNGMVTGLCSADGCIIFPLALEHDSNGGSAWEAF